MDALTGRINQEIRRAGYFALSLVIVNLVADGWARQADQIVHQLFMLPVTVGFLWFLYQLLGGSTDGPDRVRWSARQFLALALLFEAAFLGLFLYECHRFAAFGYRLHLVPAVIVFTGACALLALTLREGCSSGFALFATLFASVGGLVLAIISFPLNYLRSDMLAVIFWADRSMLFGIDPYATLHVATRLYDFPYLPGMMLAYYPAAVFGVDLRFASAIYLCGLAGLVFWASRPDRRMEVVSLLALFLLGPFLQYRHELYLQPHWFTLVLVFVLMQRRHFAWAALAFGISMAIYQFSWILFPFFLLNGLRRRGWGEAGKLALLGVAGTLVVVGPFLRTASRHMANNTVGQWGHKSVHALAAPMNLSFWVTYVLHPDKLLWLQAALMIGIFFYCFARGRCVDLADTLRWMIIALTTFVMFNVIVDGYFYLMLLVPMLAFTCVANGWWQEPKGFEARPMNAPAIRPKTSPVV